MSLLPTVGAYGMMIPSAPFYPMYCIRLQCSVIWCTHSHRDQLCVRYVQLGISWYCRWLRGCPLDIGFCVSYRASAAKFLPVVRCVSLLGVGQEQNLAGLEPPRLQRYVGVPKASAPPPIHMKRLRPRPTCPAAPMKSHQAAPQPIPCRPNRHASAIPGEVPLSLSAPWPLYFSFAQIFNYSNAH